MEVVYCKVYKETATKIAKRFLLLFCLIFIFSFQSVAQVDAATITMSGTLYTDEGVTTAGSGKTIKIAVGTSTPSVHSTTTASDGTWQITDIDNASLSTTTPFSVWLDGDANDATTLVMGYSGSDITGIPLYYAYTLANATSSTATINVGSFAFYDSGDDSDILYLVTSTSTIINSNLLIKQGVFSAPTTTLSISGNYKNNGTLSHNYGSIFLTGVSKTIDGSLTESNAFYNLNISGSYTISTTSASTTNVFIKNTGSLVAPQNLTVSGNFGNAGTFDSNSGNLYLDNDRTEVLSYLVGRDSNGYSLGTSSLAVNTLAVKDDYLYVGKAGNFTACSQTVGSASGCELMVYDYSSSTNPTYVTGMDVNGLNAGTSTSDINSLYVFGNYLYVGKNAGGIACSQTAGSASGCELMVFDISSSTNPIYVAGMDTSGIKNGTSSQGAFLSMSVSGDYLYVVRPGNSTACSQTAGSATGCELQVYNISSSTNPTYVAGRDASGTSNGTGNSSYNKLLIKDNYLYVGKGGDVNDCSAVVIGCELQIYDISSSTNPTYVTGRDVDGTSSGTASVSINNIFISDDFIYVAKAASSTACSQTAGSASGCELMVFDISSSTNPTYVAGRDADGTNDGVTAVLMNSLIVHDSYLYITKGSAGPCSRSALYASGCELMVFDISSSTNPIYVVGQDASGMNDGSTSSGFNVLSIVNNYLIVGKTGSATACVQVGGNASGCELMILSLPKGSVVGNLTSNNSLTNLVSIGSTQILSVASTTDLNIQTNSTNTIYGDLTISGNYTNNGVSIFNPNKYLYFSSDFTQTISGILVGTSSLPRVVFSGTGTKTLNDNSSTTNFYNISGSSVIAPSVMTVLGDYTNNGNFDHDDGLVEIKNKVIRYIAGRDSGGDSVGSGASIVYDFAISGNYLYAVKPANSTACSQTAGSASGCELMVFDISSSTNPTYVAGRDASGSNNGTSNIDINKIYINGNYVFIVKDKNSTACSQTAGSASGCELMVFDISSSTNPTYVAGRDASGDDTGVSSVDVISLTISDSFLYLGKSASSTACSQTAGSASGCELMVFDISSSTNPTYVAGRDASGSNGGIEAVNFNYLTVSNSYLYVGKNTNSTACSQTAGSASGCELMVFDISSSTNPTYVAGRDASGDDTGTGGGVFYGIFIRDSYLFTIGGSGTSTACSQTAGSASGCELMVFDISSSTNPTYVAGRDTSGSNNGTNSSYFLSYAVTNDYLYVGKLNESATVCSQTAGSASGCELMVFDISSSTNPVYFANNDSSGSPYGTNYGGGLSTNDIYSVIVYGNYLYIGKSNDSTACSQTAGSASGCELMVFEAVPFADLSGIMTGTSDFNNLTITGVATMSDNASTTNLTIATSSTLTAPSYLTVSGDLSNYGTFTHSSGTVILFGTSQDLVSPATTTFYNLTKSVSSADTLTFTAGGTYVTEGELTLNGVSGNRLSLRSSSTTGEWYIDPQATATVSYLDVQDSNNINVTTITCTTGCLDNDRNTNWTFSDPVNFVSTDNYHFYVGQATTTLDTITITKSSGVSDIVSANDMRITIATTTSNFRFDTNNTTLSFGGTASGKVSNTVSYENAGATLVLNVTSDFVNEDTLTIGGIQVGNFSSVSTSSSYFTLYTSGSISGTAVATDTKTINISGSLTLDNHSQGRTSNQFSFQNINDETLFTFSVIPNNENATVTDMVITLSGIQEVTSDEISDFKLYRDLDSDGALSGGDELLDGGGILTINGQHGAITFSTDFLATSTADYIVTFDTSNIDRGDSFVVSLLTSGVTATGVTSVYDSYVVGTVSNVQHERHGAGAGGSSGRIGDDAPAGNGIVTGGEEGGGGGVGEEEDGENIAHDPNFIKPSATGDIDNEWTNPSNALNSDGSYATAGSAALKQSYNGFSFGIPGGNTVLGVEVKIDASGSTANGTIDVALSWDGGSSYTTGKATPTLSGTDIVYSVGGSGDTWGRSWTATEFNPTNFRLRVTANPNSNTLRLDALEVRVYHQSTGGGGGGGGGI